MYRRIDVLLYVQMIQLTSDPSVRVSVHIRVSCIVFVVEGHTVNKLLVLCINSFCVAFSSKVFFKTVWHFIGTKEKLDML